MLPYSNVFSMLGWMFEEIPGTWGAEKLNGCHIEVLKGPPEPFDGAKELLHCPVHALRNVGLSDVEVPPGIICFRRKSM